MIVETSRGRFHVRRTGDHGPPVLMLHPLALSGAVWEPVAQYLGESHRVAAPDARGHGGSGWDGEPFTVADMAGDAAAVIEELDLGPAHVVGLSMGGSTAVVLAAARPDLVEGLVLADTTACYGPGRVDTWAERARKALATPRKEQVEFQLDRWFSPDFLHRNRAEADRVAGIFRATDSRAHAAACTALGDLDATGLLGGIRARTLVLVGDEDYATPPAMAEALADGIPGATLRVLPATRHLSLVERPGTWPLIARHLAGDLVQESRDG
ncbi:alpha/beta fold hydrolase [Streptomyces sp. HNM0575]|uniref:alpha/beta fold hydrolase n=1 Tax=Streptomyces sp. HNM0575 TaxID=2716338 RepID=UPI00145D35DF|nr:alpha/beta fold hydrolase [Streptomyces sp. HNM0575]NLU75001.1 alpha/beta fold hydrolase [Streptomyces sp. HNM0575]